MRDTKNVVGHVGSARSTMVSVPSSGSVRPSTICRVGPTPATMFIRTAVTVVSPTVVKWVENPPPGKYSWVAEWKVVAARSAWMSSSVRSHQCLMTGVPSASASHSVALRVLAPEFLKSTKPPAARPVSS